MRCSLLILLLTYFVPLQCSISNYFFVTRRDNKEAICIYPRMSYRPFPTFDLDKLQIPRDVGFKHWDWLEGWQLQNDTNMRRRGKSKVLIAGNRPFHLVAGYYDGATVIFLASNVSLWMADENEPRGAGMLLELDHLNETTKLKDTTLKYCDQNPEVKGAECTIVDYKNGTNFLNDGNHWIHFEIRLKENRTGVEMFERSYRKENTVVQCTWNNTNISNPFPSQKFYSMFAKSDQRNAAIYNREIIFPYLANNKVMKVMKRKYTKRSSGKFCVQVLWNLQRSNDTIEMMEVKNLASGRVQPATKTTHHHDSTKFQWDHLAAGEYEFTLRFDFDIFVMKGQPIYINLCNDDDGTKIERTWVSIPKAITKCQFHVGRDTEFSVGPSSPPDPTLKPDWTLEQWAYVCEQLGIGSNDAEVQIKFCNLKGCNFSKCPHLQHEPANIFDFATENITYQWRILVSVGPGRNRRRRPLARSAKFCWGCVTANP